VSAEPNQSPSPKKEPVVKGSPINFLWLIPAFLPAVITLCTRKNTDLMPENWFWILNGVCSSVAGFGFWFGMTKRKVLRGLAGLVTSGFILFLNFAIVAVIIIGLVLVNFAVAFYQGCCKGGPGV